METRANRNPPEVLPGETASNQLERFQFLADRIEALASELLASAVTPAKPVAQETTLRARARHVYGARRKVDEVFGMAGFAVSPAWDIMLDLFQAAEIDRKVSVTSASIAAACPATTALRWITVLENMELIVRKKDPGDRRRTIIEMSEVGRIKVASALRAY